MKTIRIATGVKRVDLSQEDFSAMAKIRELLKEHRYALISRLLGDPVTYLTYQFKTKVSQQQIDNIKDRLSQLKNAEVSSIRYDDVISEILTHEMTYVKSEPFYFEINEIIGEELDMSQLKLVR